jgi:glycerol-3-phosphate cytidylyltransferase
LSALNANRVHFRGIRQFHKGHLNILRRAKLECDYLIAAVVSDEIALAVKRRTAYHSLAERIEIVRSMKPVG